MKGWAEIGRSILLTWCLLFSPWFGPVYVWEKD